MPTRARAGRSAADHVPQPDSADERLRPRPDARTPHGFVQVVLVVNDTLRTDSVWPNIATMGSNKSAAAQSLRRPPATPKRAKIIPKAAPKTAVGRPRVALDERKVKVSIALSNQQLAWATQRAAELGISVSSVVQVALANLKRDQDLAALLELLGGTEDISAEEKATYAAERKAAGLTW